MTQASLFGPPEHVPYQRRSRTSRQAAERITRQGTRGLRGRALLDAYAQAGETGLTGAEAERAARLPLSSVCSLRHFAVSKGWLVPHGARVGPYQHDQQVHRITAAGRAALDAGR